MLKCLELNQKLTAMAKNDYYFGMITIFTNNYVAIQLNSFEISL